MFGSLINHLYHDANKNVWLKPFSPICNSTQLNTGWPFDMVLLNISWNVSWIQQQWQLIIKYWKKKRLTVHGDISSYCLFLSYSIACDANIFPSMVRVITGDVQLFGAPQMNPRFFPSYLRFRKTRRITIQKQGGWHINCYILWHFCKLDRN